MYRTDQIILKCNLKKFFVFLDIKKEGILDWVAGDIWTDNYY